MVLGMTLILQLCRDVIPIPCWRSTWEVCATYYACWFTLFNTSLQAYLGMTPRTPGFHLRSGATTCLPSGQRHLTQVRDLAVSKVVEH